MTLKLDLSISKTAALPKSTPIVAIKFTSLPPRHLTIDRPGIRAVITSDFPNSITIMAKLIHNYIIVISMSKFVCSVLCLLFWQIKSSKYV